jgi:hypothetical protein
MNNEVTISMGFDPNRAALLTIAREVGADLDAAFTLADASRSGDGLPADRAAWLNESTARISQARQGAIAMLNALNAAASAGPVGLDAVPSSVEGWKLLADHWTTNVVTPLASAHPSNVTSIGAIAKSVEIVVDGLD